MCANARGLTTAFIKTGEMHMIEVPILHVVISLVLHVFEMTLVFVLLFIGYSKEDDRNV